MKKILAVILLVMLLMCCACSNGSKAGSCLEGAKAAWLSLSTKPSAYGTTVYHCTYKSLDDLKSRINDQSERDVMNKLNFPASGHMYFFKSDAHKILVVETEDNSVRFSLDSIELNQTSRRMLDTAPNTSSPEYYKSISEMAAKAMLVEELTFATWFCNNDKCSADGSWHVLTSEQFASIR